MILIHVDEWQVNIHRLLRSPENIKWTSAPPVEITLIKAFSSKTWKWNSCAF